LLNSEEAISEARMRRIIIRGLKPEYIPFVTSIQRWAQQPSLEEFENLLSSQELLVEKLASVFVKDGEGDALVADKRKFIGKTLRDRPHSQFQSCSIPLGNEGESTNNYKTLKCYQCGKIGHIKRFCRTKESNMAQTEKVVEGEEDWGKCFVAETRAIDAMTSINFERDWIVDSGCGHHLTENDESKFFDFHKYNGRDVIVTTNNTVHHDHCICESQKN